MNTKETLDVIWNAKAFMHMTGIDFDVGEPIEAWLVVEGGFIPDRSPGWAANFCHDVGEATDVAGNQFDHN